MGLKDANRGFDSRFTIFLQRVAEHVVHESKRQIYPALFGWMGPWGVTTHLACGCGAPPWTADTLYEKNVDSKGSKSWHMSVLL